MTFSLDYNGLGSVEIATETSPHNIKTVIGVIHSQVQKMKHHPISTTELERLKNKRILDAVQEPMYKGPSKYIDRYAEYFFYDKPIIMMKDRLELIKRITKKDIMKVASLVFPDKTLLVSYSGPKECRGIRI